MKSRKWVPKFQNSRHQAIFDLTSGKQRENLIARLKKGYEITRADGHGGIEMRKGRLYRYLGKSGKDIQG